MEEGSDPEEDIAAR
jgi:hypothetical protein